MHKTSTATSTLHDYVNEGVHIPEGEIKGSSGGRGPVVGGPVEDGGRQ
jgi:hypothetical protein